MPVGLLPRKCPGTTGEFRSCLVPFRFWESLVWALPPPLGLPQLIDTEWQVGSSCLLVGSRKRASFAQSGGCFWELSGSLAAQACP